jgi:hypothetical protein
MMLRSALEGKEPVLFLPPGYCVFCGRQRPMELAVYMDVQPVQAQGVVRVVLVNSCAWNPQAGKERVGLTGRNGPLLQLHFFQTRSPQEH